MARLKLVVLAALLGICNEQSTLTPAIKVDASVRVIVDGVAPIANVYRPADPGKFLVFLVRIQYDRASGEDTCRVAAETWLHLLTLDVRGRYGSEGEWYPFKNESNDGYNTVEWAAALPESNGKVGMFGESYLGATQWLPAIAHPPHLIATL